MKNTGKKPDALTGWTIRDLQNHTYHSDDHAANRAQCVGCTAEHDDPAEPTMGGHLRRRPLRRVPIHRLEPGRRGQESRGRHLPARPWTGDHQAGQRVLHRSADKRCKLLTRHLQRRRGDRLHLVCIVLQIEPLADTVGCRDSFGRSPGLAGGAGSGGGGCDVADGAWRFDAQAAKP